MSKTNAQRLIDYLSSLDLVNALAEFCKKNKYPDPEWEHSHIPNPTATVEIKNLYTATVKIQGKSFTASNRPSKSDAKITASVAAADYLTRSGVTFFTSRPQNYISVLQMICQTIGFDIPKYEVVSIGLVQNLGPFIAIVYLNGQSFHSKSDYPKKQDAKVDAAEVAIREIGNDENVLFMIQKSYPGFDYDESVAVHGIICQRNVTPVGSNVKRMDQTKVISQNSSASLNIMQERPASTSLTNFTSQVENLVKRNLVPHPFYSYKSQLDPATGQMTHAAQLLIKGKCYTTDKPYSSKLAASNEVSRLFLKEFYPDLVDDEQSRPSSSSQTRVVPTKSSPTSLKAPAMPNLAPLSLPVASSIPHKSPILSTSHDYPPSSKKLKGLSSNQPVSVVDTLMETMVQKPINTEDAENVAYMSDDDPAVALMCPTYIQILAAFLQKKGCSHPIYRFDAFPPGYKCTASFVHPYTQMVHSITSHRPHLKKANAKEDAAKDLYFVAQKLLQ